MKRQSFFTVLIGLTVVSGPLCAAPLSVALPTDVSPAQLEVGLYGRGLCLRTVGLPPGFVDLEELAASCSVFGHDFRPIDEVRLLLAVPGYQIVTLAPAPDQGSWQPEFAQLPTVTLSGHLEPPSEHPLNLTIEYHLLEAMTFFEYTDGGVPSVLIAQTTTEPNGAFEVDAPDLRRDPFVASQEGFVIVRADHSDRAPDRGTDVRYRLTLRQLYETTPLILDQRVAWPPNPFHEKASESQAGRLGGRPSR